MYLAFCLTALVRRRLVCFIPERKVYNLNFCNCPFHVYSLEYHLLTSRAEEVSHCSNCPIGENHGDVALLSIPSKNKENVD